MKSFIESQFACCPLVLICHDKTSNNHINHLHGLALSTIFKDYESIFKKLLQKEHSANYQKEHSANYQKEHSANYQKEHSATICQRNLRILQSNCRKQKKIYPFQ